MVGLGVIGTGGRQMANPGVPGTPGAAGLGEATLGLFIMEAATMGDAAMVVSMGVATLLLTMKLFILPKCPDEDPTPGLDTDIS